MSSRGTSAMQACRAGTFTANVSHYEIGGLSMKRHITPIVVAGALAFPAVGAAVTPKKKVITQWKKAMGPAVVVDRWGEIQVVLVVRKRTTIVGTKKTIARKITAVRLPVWPNQGGTHTIGLNRQ